MTPQAKAIAAAIEAIGHVLDCDDSKSICRTCTRELTETLAALRALPVDEPRFFLSTDGSGHWFYIPVEMRMKWSEWREFHEDDERSWTVPEFAIAVNCHPAAITFTDPRFA